MLTETAFLLIGLILIVKGGDLFVSASVHIAELLDMPRMVIGSTLVSLGTTSPELVVSIMAGVHGESELAVGNAVGSCMCNLGLILGVIAIVKQIEVHPRLLHGQLVSLFALASLLFLLTLDLAISRFQGGALLLGGIGYFVHDFRKHLRPAASPVEIVEAKAIEEQAVAGHRLLANRLGTTFQFIAGAVLIIAGSKCLVDGAVGIATGFGVSPVVIGLTVVALGTSLPELATAITSARKNVSDLAVGNVLGANIANLSLIIGSAASIDPVHLDRATQAIALPMLMAGIAVLWWVLRTRPQITRRHGALLLAFYALHLSIVIIVAALTK